MDEYKEFQYNEAQVTKCSSCGADMYYNPVLGKLKCDYCDCEKSITKYPSYFRDYESEKSEGTIKHETQTYKCPNCGGTIELKSFETATKCPFCGATAIISYEDLKGMKPDSILPFLYSKDNAAAAGKKWMKKKLLAPHSLKKSLDIQNFKGLYFPSFGFNVKTVSNYDGRLGEKKTRTVGVGKDRHTETYIEWYRVKGTWSQNFNNVMVEASTQITQKELNNILPYDMDDAEAYNKEYLSGFGAERYDTSIESSYKIAQAQIDDKIRKAILDKYHADEVDYLNIYSTYSDKKFRYTLLPLWVCAYKYKEKFYRFIVNGRNGKATGKAPTSPLRVMFVTLIILAIAAGAIILGYLNK